MIQGWHGKKEFNVPFMRPNNAAENNLKKATKGCENSTQFEVLIVFTGFYECWIDLDLNDTDSSSRGVKHPWGLLYTHCVDPF